MYPWAYLALLPHSTLRAIRAGFKRLRQPMKKRSTGVASPAEDVKREEVGDEHENTGGGVQGMLASERDRFQPSAWQKFIQQLNQCSMDEIDKLRWQRDIAMKTGKNDPLSCPRHCWRSVRTSQPQGSIYDAEGEELKHFWRPCGDAFDLG